MAYFFVRATWKTAAARPTVALAFYRSAREGAPLDADVTLAEMLGDDVPLSRRLIGELDVTDLSDVTPLRVRRIAIDWLRDEAGLTVGDVLEIERSVQFDADLLDRLAELAPA